MEVIFGNKTDKIIRKSTGIGLGNFDGLHLGHMFLINKLIQESKIEGLNPLVYTFANHPQNILTYGQSTFLITPIEKKIDLLKKIDLKYLYFDEFNQDLLNLSPELFIKTILVKKFHMKLAVVGANYRFGYKSRGDVELLINMGKRLGYRVKMILPVMYEQKIISSTRIRKYISNGDVKGAAEMLGRHYSIQGTVIHGKSIGKTIGIPTVNMSINEQILIPKQGVYATRILIEGVLYKSITNIGKNPTIGLSEGINLETHIIGFNGNVYDKHVEVFFINWIREEKEFKSKEQLVAQIRNDIHYIMTNTV